ncbi:MAG: Gfo/Idh/MocA family oxidoreductase [Candidatus Brocadiaceae bacterium]|nr:Gfo/Idh/MocA family oxidoreductase [Candidatus Brocadiaceae bacterium]
MIRIAIVGTGGMANTHARAYADIKGCKLVAACDVVPERARAFAERHGMPHAFSNLDEMLAEVEFDALSNVTSDAAHAPVSLRAIAAGRHVLCEKPLATNYPDARRMAAAAKRKGVVSMVNFSYRNSAAIHRAHDMIRRGDIGRVMHVEASYLQSWLTSSHWGDWRSGSAWLWRLSTAHGSKGVLGDIGVHIIDFASYAAGDIRSVNCRLKTFPKARGDRIGEYRLDANDSAVITVETADGAIGTIHTTRWATGHKNSLLLRVYGEEGGIIVDLDRSYTELQVCRGRNIRTQEWSTVRCAATPTIYQRFIKSIRTGVNDQPDFARGAAVQKVLDACFESDAEGRAVKV